MERDCCELICGALTTFQGYGIEQNTIEYLKKQVLLTVQTNSNHTNCQDVDNTDLSKTAIFKKLTNNYNFYNFSNSPLMKNETPAKETK